MNCPYGGFRSRRMLFMFLDSYFSVTHVSYSYYQNKYNQNQISVERYNELKQILIDSL